MHCAMCALHLNLCIKMPTTPMLPVMLGVTVLFLALSPLYRSAPLHGRDCRCEATSVQRCADSSCPLQEQIFTERKYQGKDTSFDLVKMLRWRWRELGGIEQLTGNHTFTLRPMWAGLPDERSRRNLQKRMQEGGDLAPGAWQGDTQRLVQRQPLQSRPLRQRQGKVKDDDGNLQQPPAKELYQPLPIDW